MAVHPTDPAAGTAPAERSEGITVILFADVPWWSWLLSLLIFLLSLFLIVVVLIQRGKGGGLAGAFGGIGGSSPFGSRAGDRFMWFTLAVAGLWLLLIIAQVKVVQATGGGPTDDQGTIGADG
jgi:preprotein translocase subunit SecG